VYRTPEYESQKYVKKLQIMKPQVLLIIALILNFYSCTNNKKEFYVSPGGNDKNPGTKGRPFSSFNKAKDEVARAIADGTKNKEIHVYFRGGTYSFDKSVVIKGEEFVSGNNKIIFSSYHDEKPLFSSGRILTGWSKMSDNPSFLPETAKGKVWVATFTGSKSRPIARFLCTDSAPLVNAVSVGIVTDENDERNSKKRLYVGPDRGSCSARYAAWENFRERSHPWFPASSE